MINREVAESRAKPLFIYGKERAEEQRLSRATGAARARRQRRPPDVQGLAARSRRADIRSFIRRNFNRAIVADGRMKRFCGMRPCLQSGGPRADCPEGGHR